MVLPDHTFPRESAGLESSLGRPLLVPQFEGVLSFVLVAHWLAQKCSSEPAARNICSFSHRAFSVWAAVCILLLGNQPEASAIKGRERERHLPPPHYDITRPSIQSSRQALAVVPSSPQGQSKPPISLLLRIA